MPAPYTDPEQDALIDQLLADVATLQTDVGDLETRVAAIEATLAILEPDFATAQADIASLQTDSTTHGNNITTLQSDVSGIDARVTTLENATVPAVDTLQEDVATLRVGAKDRQVNDTAQLGKPQLVLRPSIERVKRPDGRLVQRVGKPR
jgi:cell division septum initiation protein DivIVA